MVEHKRELALGALALGCAFLLAALSAREDRSLMLLLIAVAVCFVVIAFLLVDGPQYVAVSLGRKATSDPMLATLESALAASDVERERATRVAASRVPITTLAQRANVLGNLVHQGRKLEKRTHGERGDEFPHYSNDLMSDIGSWRSQVSKELSSWGDLQRAFDKTPHFTRDADQHMTDVNITPCIETLQDVCRKIKRMREVTADPTPLRRLFLTGQRLQSELTSTPGRVSWDTDRIVEVGSWWNDVQAALLPWPARQRAFPHYGFTGNNDRHDLSAPLKWMELFLKELGGE